MSKKRMIALDADYLLFMCTEGKDVKASYFSREDGSANGKYKEPLKPYKKKLKMLIQDVEDEIAVNFPGQIAGIKPCFSDPNGNFRYEFYPEYKAGRPPRSKLWYRLHKWALKKYGYRKGIEADDEVAYLVREENWIGASMDKDLWKGVEGDWFNVHYMRRCFTTCSPMEARNFNLIQTLTGDSDDNIPGIYGVGEATAIKLLDKYGWHWDGVVAAYENHIRCHTCGKVEKWDTTKIKDFEHDGDLMGTCPKCNVPKMWYQYNKDDAILARRLICMRQWHPKRGVTLWEESTDE